MNMKKFQVVFLFLFLVGCSSNQIPATTMPHVTPTSSLLPTDTIVSPTQTLTSTPLPVLTFPLLWTPFPTFFQTDDVEKLRFWLQGTSDCILPCWGDHARGNELAGSQTVFRANPFFIFIC
jgi:hypothetical protein